MLIIIGGAWIDLILILFQMDQLFLTVNQPLASSFHHTTIPKSFFQTPVEVYKKFEAKKKNYISRFCLLAGKKAFTRFE